MESVERRSVASPATSFAQEMPMLKEQVVAEIVARLARGTPVLALAREYGVDPKTIRNWRDKGAYQPRRSRVCRSILDPYAAWLRARAPEVEYNAVVLTRELRAQGYTGSGQQVYRFVRPLRAAAHPPAATVRYETAPGQQAQVDFGQRRVWIADTVVTAHVFVFTLGYSRRLYPHAFTHERLDAVLAGHEQAFHHFGGVPEMIVLDNARPVVLAHRRALVDERLRHQVLWHPIYLDFARYYGFQPWAHWPHRPQTKGKTESGVKYVARNALVGKRFGSWTHLNGWLLDWSTTVADVRLHGTTHEAPAIRFTRERLTPLGSRPLYAREQVRHRVVPSDALVAIGGSRYSVPVRYVGAQVTVRELLGSYEILYAGTVIARHASRGRHQVVMEPAHYDGLLRPDPTQRAAAPPRFDPDYPLLGDVAVRDLTVYADLVAAEDARS